MERWHMQPSSWRGNTGSAQEIRWWFNSWVTPLSRWVEHLRVETTLKRAGNGLSSLSTCGSRNTLVISEVHLWVCLWRRLYRRRGKDPSCTLEKWSHRLVQWSLSHHAKGPLGLPRRVRILGFNWRRHLNCGQNYLTKGSWTKLCWKCRLSISIPPSSAPPPCTCWLWMPWD